MTNLVSRSGDSRSKSSSTSRGLSRSYRPRSVTIRKRNHWFVPRMVIRSEERRLSHMSSQTLYLNSSPSRRCISTSPSSHLRSFTSRHKKFPCSKRISHNLLQQRHKLFQSQRTSSTRDSCSHKRSNQIKQFLRCLNLFRLKINNRLKFRLQPSLVSCFRRQRKARSLSLATSLSKITSSSRTPMISLSLGQMRATRRRRLKATMKTS